MMQFNYAQVYESPIGTMTMTGDGEALTGIWFNDQSRFACKKDADLHMENLPVFKDAIRWLDIYFEGGIPDFIPNLAFRTTPFCEDVCRILLEIPYGKTMSYGEIARRIAAVRGMARMSAQAVGGAVGRNPISIIVPCHRVIGSDGSMTGYGGGLWRKEWLLKLEGSL